VTSPVQITDWMPTLCALAGYQPAQDLKWDGANITSLLTRHEELPTRPLYAVGPNWRSRSLRYGNWKLLLLGEGSSTKIELYDLAQDPSESLNLTARQPERVQQLQALLAERSARDRDAVAKD
jgi:arylsulfatase A-like enzyme